jgi:hypothetical protein
MIRSVLKKVLSENRVVCPGRGRNIQWRKPEKRQLDDSFNRKEAKRMEMAGSDLQQLNDNPLYQTLGIRIEEACDGKAQSCLIPNPNVCWPFPGQVHGGILATVMDTTMAWAVFSKLEQGLTCTMPVSSS